MLCASSSTRSPPQGSPCGLFRCCPSAHTACASGERGCLRCGAYGLRTGALRRNSGRTGGKTAAARRAVGTSGTALAGRIRKRHRHAGARASMAVIGRAHAQFSSLRRPHCCAAGKKSATWPDEGGHILGCCPQRPLHIADEALEEPGGSPSGEEGPLSGGLARDLFLKELRARIGEKWGLLPDGDAAGFPLLFFVRRMVLRASGALHL